MGFVWSMVAATPEFTRLYVEAYDALGNTTTAHQITMIDAQGAIVKGTMRGNTYSFGSIFDIDGKTTITVDGYMPVEVDLTGVDQGTISLRIGKGKDGVSVLDMAPGPRADLAAALFGSPLAGSAGGTGGSDDCATSDPIAGDGSYAVTLGSTGAEGQDNAICLDFGSTAIDNDVWFCWTAVGGGDTTATTCGDASSDTKIAVYDGCACPPAGEGNPLDCNDDDCGLQSTVAWTSVDGNQYLIQVGNFPGTPPGGSSTMVITTTGGGPSGSITSDDCASPDALSGQGSFPFDQTAATTGVEGQGNAACDAFGSTALDNDVWGCWTADADCTVTAETCGSAPDTKLAVYDGCACPPAGEGNPLACNDDFCGLQSSVQWSATAGSQYLIQLGNFPGTAGGTGSLSITCAEPPGEVCTQPAENCTVGDLQNASNSSTTAGFVTQDNFSASASGAITDICWWGTYLPGQEDDDFTVTYYADNGSGFPGAVLGSFSQSGGTLTVSGPVDTGNLIAGIAPEFEYTGSHGPIPVVAGECYWLEVVNTPALGGSWFWEWGVDDGLALQNGSPLTNDLKWCLDQPLGDTTQCGPEPPANDDCENAEGPVAVPSVTAGTTNGASIDGVPTCGTSNTAPGVWYSVIGTGNTMTASTCDGAAGGSATYDSKISVFCDGCVNLVCVGGNDDSCSDGSSGLLSTVNWCSQAGAEYLILVHGFGSATGDFELSVFDDGIGCAAEVACLPQGACCLPSGACIISPEGACNAAGGSYQGDDTDCSGQANDAVITVDILTDDFGNETTWTIVDQNSGAEVAAGGPYPSNTQIIEDVPVYSGGCYTFCIFDAFGDGICCGYGQGAYSVLFDGSLVASGGEFLDVECTSDIGGCAGMVPGPGACCLPDQSCVVTTQTCCDFAGGEYQGDGIACFEPSGNIVSSMVSAPGAPISSTLPPTEDDIVMGMDVGIADLDVDVNITHTFLGDLEITLTHVDTGTSAFLWDNDCGSNNDMMVTFDDEGSAVACGTPTTGSVDPGSTNAEGDLSVFDGESSAGTWRLTIDDTFGGDDGTLDSWQLHFEEGEPVCRGIVGTLIIKQGACPAPVNPSSNGVTPMVLTGQGGDEPIDVSMIDLSTIALERCDGMGGSVAPNDGPPGPGIRFNDLNHPNMDDVGCDAGQVPCACNADQSSDGIDDLDMMFRTSDMADAGLLDGAAGDIVVLKLTCELLDGTPIEAYDCVRIAGQGLSAAAMNLMIDAPADAFVQSDKYDDNLDSAWFYPGTNGQNATYVHGTQVTLSAPAALQDGLRIRGWRVSVTSENGPWLTVNSQEVSVTLSDQDTTHVQARMVPLVSKINGGPISGPIGR